MSALLISVEALDGGWSHLRVYERGSPRGESYVRDEQLEGVVDCLRRLGELEQVGGERG